MTDKEDRVRQRAYEIWQRSGQQEGSALEHWLQASREIDAEDAGPVVAENMIEDTASTAGPEGAASLSEPSAGTETTPAPRTAGASTPGPDTSRSPVANRDRGGPRKASTTPRPTDKPIAGR